ncbi:FecR family protein [Taibaiella koreensis]|uniref:FecR family protein n=1 Tax=Taibaiella koreensis TaxID=1268548 RepID=UPI000E5A083D|nr:FecR domain-containing protein [Taibaiella koreensis]
MIDFDIVIKYIAGKAAPEEAIHVEEWIGASGEHRAFFHSLHQSWLEQGPEAYQVPDVKKEWEAFRQKVQPSAPVVKPQSPTRLWLGRAAAAAAIIAVAAAGFYLFNSKNQNEPTLIAVAKDKPQEVRLTDGSSMIVEPGGELVYPVRFKKDSREVTLVGSGSFRIAPLPGQPFTVHLGELHVRTAGTSFSVHRGDKDLSVRVNEGEATFYNKKDTLHITAGATGRYIWKGRQLRLEAAVPLTGTFHFNNTPLNVVVATLNAHFKANIRLANARLNSCTLSAGFERQTLDDILRDIAETFDLSYKTNKSYIDINGAACK